MSRNEKETISSFFLGLFPFSLGDSRRSSIFSSNKTLWILYSYLVKGSSNSNFSVGGILENSVMGSGSGGSRMIASCNIDTSFLVDIGDVFFFDELFDDFSFREFFFLLEVSLVDAFLLDSDSMSVLSCSKYCLTNIAYISCIRRKERERK